jgi:3-oxoacyl-[acyl-carrier protein] reductase
VNPTSREPSESQPRTLRGLNAVVTGASSGIGRAISLAFATAGCEQVLVHFHRNQHAAQDTALQVESHGTKALIDSCDFANHGEASHFIERAFGKLTRVDVWVHCAGADVLTGDAGNATFEQKLDRLIAVDLVGSIQVGREVGARLSAQALSAALPQVPSMQFIGWDQATEGMEGDAGQMFSPIKAGVEAFAKSLAQHLAPHVRVNTLAPGWIKTAWGESTSAYWNQRACTQALMSRWGTPEDVAAAAVFLASPGSAFISGHTLPINGGWNRRYPQ